MGQKCRLMTETVEFSAEKTALETQIVRERERMQEEIRKAEDRQLSQQTANPKAIEKYKSSFKDSNCASLNCKMNSLQYPHCT